MARTFSFEFSASGTPEAAATRLQRVLTERLRRPSGGGAASNIHREMRLSKQDATSLAYRPALRIPMPVSIIVWLGRLLSGEKVNVAFAPNGGDGQTRVAVSGKVGRGGQAVADREFWTDALDASNSSRG